MANPAANEISATSLRGPVFEEQDGTVVDYSATTIPELISSRAEAAPESLAIAAGTRQVSYGELEVCTNRLAAYLREAGVGPGVPVGICLERSPELIIAALATLKAGGAYIPLDPEQPIERKAFMLQDAGAPMAFIRGDAAVELIAAGVRAERMEEALRQAAIHAPTAVPCSAGGTDLAYIIYTSGSTGQPKGVAISHASLNNLIAWHLEAFRVTARDRATQIANPAFDAAVWEIWPYLAKGASLHIPAESARLEPETLRDWLVQQKITMTFLPTPLAERLLVLEWPRETQLRILLTGGDALQHAPPPGLPFVLVNNYGPTECTVVATSGEIRPGQEGTPGIGRAIRNTQAYILDESLRPVPDGTPGELCLSGTGVACGYVNRAQLTAEKFVHNPFTAGFGPRLYRTGDRVRRLADGQIAFLGRMDDQIKIHGYRIEPDEIVATLNQHPDVAGSVVIAREEAEAEKRLVAYVVPRRDADPTEHTLREFLSQKLPDYMVPSVFVRLQALPLTAHGKVDRAALPSPTPNNTLREEPYVAPRNPIEQRLAGILSTLMGLEQVGINDNFFLLGGHSLLGTQVIARVRDAFRVELPLRSVFDAPTISNLSAEIERLILSKLHSGTRPAAS